MSSVYTSLGSVVPDVSTRAVMRIDNSFMVEVMVLSSVCVLMGGPFVLRSCDTMFAFTVVVYGSHFEHRRHVRFGVVAYHRGWTSG